MVQNRRTEQAVSEDQYSESRAEDDYEDDFESVSKSQLGMSMGKPANKKVEESYSNEAFESFGESKTLSGEDKGIKKHRRPGKFSSPIKETDDEKHSSMNEVSEEDDSYSSASSAKPKNSKAAASKQQQQPVQSSYMSSDLSVSNPAAAAFSKQVQDFMKGGDSESESNSGLATRVQRASALLEESESSPSKSGGSVQKPRGENVDKNIENINALYERYKMFKKLAAKYGGGDGGSGDLDDESSATISKSQ